MLACVFVRYMEDNDLIAETYLAGTGDRRRQAEDAHEALLPRPPARQRPRLPARRLPQGRLDPGGPRPVRRGQDAGLGRRPLGRRRRAAAGVLAGDRPRDRRPAAFVPSRGGRHAVPGRPVPGPLRGGPQEVRAVADARLRRGVHPRPHADAGARRVRPGGGPADRPDLRLGPLPAGGVPAAVRPLERARAGDRADRAGPAGARRGVRRRREPVRGGDRAVPADRRGDARLRHRAGSRMPRAGTSTSRSATA